MLAAIVVAFEQTKADDREEHEDRNDGAPRPEATEPRLTVHTPTPNVSRATGLPMPRRSSRRRKAIDISEAWALSDGTADLKARREPRGTSAPAVATLVQGSSEPVGLGQTYSVAPCEAAGATHSRAMPHLGHVPGADCRISACIGQV